jgi:hypothetical protein
VTCIDSSLCVYADTMEWLLAFKRQLSNQWADVTGFASLVSVTDSWANHLIDDEVSLQHEFYHIPRLLSLYYLLCLSCLPPIFRLRLSLCLCLFLSLIFPSSSLFIFRALSFLAYFTILKNWSRLMRSRCCVCVSVYPSYRC